MTESYPTTKEGTVKLIVDSLSKAETTYVVFCKELSEAKDAKLLEYFCNNRCEIHRLHNSEQLLCLPISCRELLQGA